MQLSDENVTLFQELYFKRFGVALSRTEAHEKGEALVSLFKIVYSPMTKDRQNNEYKYEQGQT